MKAEWFKLDDLPYNLLCTSAFTVLKEGTTLAK
jgi:hypothetical protein